MHLCPAFCNLAINSAFFGLIMHNFVAIITALTGCTKPWIFGVLRQFYSTAVSSFCDIFQSIVFTIIKLPLSISLKSYDYETELQTLWDSILLWSCGGKGREVGNYEEAKGGADLFLNHHHHRGEWHSLLRACYKPLSLSTSWRSSLYACSRSNSAMQLHNLLIHWHICSLIAPALAHMFTAKIL